MNEKVEGGPQATDTTTLPAKSTAAWCLQLGQIEKE